MLDKLLVQEWLSEFVDTFLKSKYELQYTDFLLSENSGYFYIKLKDKLQHLYILNGNYKFNTHLVLRCSSSNIYNKPDKHGLYTYLHSLLDNSDVYSQYLVRLYNVPLPTN